MRSSRPPSRITGARISARAGRAIAATPSFQGAASATAAALAIQRAIAHRPPLAHAATAENPHRTSHGRGATPRG